MKRRTVSPALSRSSEAASLGITTPRERPHSLTRVSTSFIQLYWYNYYIKLPVGLYNMEIPFLLWYWLCWLAAGLLEAGQRPGWLYWGTYGLLTGMWWRGRT